MRPLEGIYDGLSRSPNLKLYAHSILLMVLAVPITKIPSQNAFLGVVFKK